MVAPVVVHGRDFQHAEKFDCAFHARVRPFWIMGVADGIPQYKAALNQRLLSNDRLLEQAFDFVHEVELTSAGEDCPRQSFIASGLPDPNNQNAFGPRTFEYSSWRGFFDLLDNLFHEHWQIVRATARNDLAVNNDFLINPFRPGVLHVFADGFVGSCLPAL